MSDAKEAKAKDREQREPDLEKRESEAQAKLDALKAKQAARRKSPELLEVEALEREAAQLEAIEAAVAEWGEVDEGIKVVRFEHGGVEDIVIVRRPETVAVRKFHDVGKFTVEAKDKFGRPYVVYPSKEAYGKLGSNIAIICAVADAAGWLAGFNRTKLDEKS